MDYMALCTHLVHILTQKTAGPFFCLLHLQTQFNDSPQPMGKFVRSLLCVLHDRHGNYLVQTYC